MLIDTSPVASFREAKNWRQCAQKAKSTLLYSGMRECLLELERLGIETAVVTASVSYYAKAMLTAHDIVCRRLVAWHDTPRHKPAPDPVIKAMEMLGLGPNDVIGIGDVPVDAQALSAAGVRSFCAGWNPDADRAAPWTAVLETPGDILRLLVGAARR